MCVPSEKHSRQKAETRVPWLLCPSVSTEVTRETDGPRVLKLCQEFNYLSNLSDRQREARSVSLTTTWFHSDENKEGEINMF